MKVLNHIFGKKPVTSTTIASEIAKAERDAANARDKLAGALDDIATMSDDEHEAAEAKAASFRRAIVRAEARIAELQKAHADAQANEAAAERVAADERLRARAEAARKAVNVEAVTLLDEYDALAEQIANVLERIAAIDNEVSAVNAVLRDNPVADSVRSITDTHRKHPDRYAEERTERRKCWVYHYPGSPADTEKYLKKAPWEEVREARIGPNGEAIPALADHHNYYGRTLIITPKLETREIVVEQKYFRSGAHLDDLSSVRLPPGRLNSSWHWPRRG